MKFKTPEDIAKANQGKNKFTLYLDVKSMEYIKSRADKAGTSTSKIVNEAIASYIDQLKNRKNI